MPPKALPQARRDSRGLEAPCFGIQSAIRATAAEGVVVKHVDDQFAQFVWMDLAAWSVQYDMEGPARSGDIFAATAT
jgi:hypothetical protein